MDRLGRRVYEVKLPYRRRRQLRQHSASRTQSRVAYEEASVPFGSECNSQNQVGTCNNGKWGNWNGTFEATSCVVEQPQGCDGQEHGYTQSRIAYESATVPSGSQCHSEEQTRHCDNGHWTLWTGTYSATVCEVEAPPTTFTKSCLFTSRVVMTGIVYETRNCLEYSTKRTDIFTDDSICGVSQAGLTIQVGTACPASGRIATCKVDFEALDYKQSIIYYEGTNVDMSPTVNVLEQTCEIYEGEFWKRD
jgi:hypothetical protein